MKRAGTLIFAVSVLVWAAVLPRWAGADEQLDGSRSAVADGNIGWEAFRSRLVPERAPRVKQDFGYSPTNHAGGEPGEIGGWVQRSLSGARFGARSARHTLSIRI